MKVIQPHESTAATNERLAKITATVKNLLNLNTDQYSHFTGDLDDNPMYPVWHLFWKDNDSRKSLEIDVTEGGIIKELCRHEPEISLSTQEKITLHFPTLPDGKFADAKKTAVAFLRKVLASNESFNFIEQYNNSIFSDYKFRGFIFKNNLPAGIRFAIDVRCFDNLIISYRRNQHKIIEELPSPLPKLAEEEAVSLLRNTISLYLEYRKSNEYRSYAVLQYLPKDTDEFYVDAQTGDLVDLTVLLEKKEYGQSGNMNFTDDDDDDDWLALKSISFKEHHFSKAEIKTFSRLDIPSQEELDLSVRKIPYLGLDCYKLDGIKYEDKSDSCDEQDPPVIATLTYITTETYNSSKEKKIRINSKTGDLLSVLSPWKKPAETVLSVTLDEAQKIAESFLQEVTPDIFFKCKLVKAEAAKSNTYYSWFHSFRYDRQENGFFYHQNYIEIHIDVRCGYVSKYVYSFDHAMTFEYPDNIISMKEALDKWLTSYKMTLNYVNVPFSSPNYASTDYLYTYVLGYSLVREFDPEGIFAKTGEFLKPFVPQKTISYPPDLDGHKDCEIIEELIINGIEYDEELLDSDKPLTQIDLLTLLYKAIDRPHRHTRGQKSKSETDAAVYEWATNKDIITEEEKDAQAIITRLELIKQLIHAVGLKDIAQIPGIYRTSFLDEHDIPDSMVGYAALAQGVELIEFSEDGMLHPNHIVTRGEAMLILYDLMTR